MNNLVSIVCLIEKNITQNTFFFESLGYKKIIKEEEFVSSKEPQLVNTICGLEVEIVIGIKTNNFDIDSVEKINAIADKIFVIGENINNAEAYNMLFKNCSKDYVCVVKEQFFLEPNWLQDLLLYQKNIYKSGVVSIASDFMLCEYTSLQSNDEENLVGVFCSKDEILENTGAYLFDRQLLYFVGAFDTSESINGYEFLQWQMRCTRIGFHNFYIPTKSCIHFENQMTYHPERLKIVENSVEEMRKNRNFYIPLDTF